MTSFLKKIPELFPTAFLRLFGWWKIPLLFAVAPRVVEFTEERCVVKIPLNRMTRNHLSSMYFGALCIGADCAGGLMAMRLIQQKGLRIALLFKEFKAEFLKRAEGDVFFTCAQGAEVKALVERAANSFERENLPVQVIATVRKNKGPEGADRLLVAKFELVLSLKRRG